MEKKRQGALDSSPRPSILSDLTALLLGAHLRLSLLSALSLLRYLVAASGAPLESLVAEDGYWHGRRYGQTTR